jgi:hypothetical protein
VREGGGGPQQRNLPSHVWSESGGVDIEEAKVRVSRGEGMFAHVTPKTAKRVFGLIPENVFCALNTV